jgi:ParB-like chromosome segregation protein Spo0J
MQIIDIEIKRLKEYKNNPRHNEKAVEKVAASIKAFGFKVPIVIDNNNVIVCGHTRLKAAQRLGLDVVPCIVADDLTEEQINAFRLADNKTAEFAEWDMELLEAELAALEMDMQAFGFESDDKDTDSGATERKDLSDQVEAVYEVIVECADEWQQEEIFDRLSGEGLKCRVLTL